MYQLNFPSEQSLQLHLFHYVRWGWCLPECDESNHQPNVHRYAHEAVVDAFVYENCSKGVDTRTEFCTGVPVTASFGQIWDIVEGGEGTSFVYRRNQLRHFKSDITWNGNGTVLRPGAEYQGAQHTQASWLSLSLIQ
jgi:hypothetical protein